jgi:arylsulfatase A-like enzyme/tetratricopeptide (TPR) repeat protein
VIFLRSKALLAVAIAGLAVGTWWLLRTPAFSLDVETDRNVLLISIDTLRADALGSYGGRATTPNLDRLAARGARFDFAHAHAVVTLPSHASMLTGRYPYEHGIRDNTGYRLQPGTDTLATRLKAAGFATGAFVGGFPLDSQFGLDQGFDRYDDTMGSGAADERERRADVVTASALDWIGQQSGKWFSFVHVYDPHVVYDPPAEWRDRFPNDPYLGEVSWTDHALGVLLDRINSLPRRTLVIVTADHGESLGDHGELTHGVFAYEPVLRVPLIIAELGAGVDDEAGRVITTPARHVDLVPTMLESVGVDATNVASGTSLRSVVNAGEGDDRPSYFEAMTATIQRGWAPLRGVVVQGEKYIDLPIAEWYELSADPKEARNAASVNPPRVQVLLNTLRGFNTAPPGRPRQETAETIDRLRSLGYIGGGAAAARETYTDADDPKRLIELDQWLTQAAQAQREGRPQDAVVLYQQVIAKRPDTEDAYRKLALVHWRSGRPAQAISTLEAALKQGITQSEVRIKLAQYLAESGQPQRAIELLEQMTGDDPDALIGLGNAYLAAGKSREAIAAFERLLTIDPNHALAHENIGVTHLRGGNVPAAEAALRKAVSLDAGLSGAWTALGVLLSTTGRQNEALSAWQQAITADPQSLDALYNLTVNLARLGRIGEARRFGEQYLRVAPPFLREDIATIRQIVGG